MSGREQQARATLERGGRCLLAMHGARGPLVAPMAYWYDGAAVWMSTPGRSAKVSALQRDPACALYVAPSEPGGPGVVAHGRARVFSLRDPTGLVLHGPTISAAMTVLMLRNAPSIAGYVTDAARIPARFLPRNRVVVRMGLERLDEMVAPDPPPGIAPALPTVVPSDVRRALAGQRRVVLAALDGQRLVLAPAAWSVGFALTLPAGLGVPSGADAVAALDADRRGRPTQVLGLALAGTIAPPRTLRPQRVTWWRGFDLGTADVPAAGAGSALGALTLPD